MKKHIFATAGLLLSFLAGGCSEAGTDKTAQETVLTVSAASSLQDVMEDIAHAFQEDHPTIDIRLNLGASGSLSEQIEQGAPVDLFISASAEKFHELTEQKLIEEQANLARNELVLIVPVESDGQVQQFHDLTAGHVEKVAIGTIAVVPAGTYGKQALEYYEVWDRIEKKVVYAKDVRQVLTYVETKNAQAGIVYKTDALTSHKVKVVETAEEDSHDAIFYPAGIISRTEHPEDAALFFQYLTSEEVQNSWEAHGFAME